MAEDSQRAASDLETISIRTSVSRYYYAAYQSTTALLHYRGGLQPPQIQGVDRESWTHEDTPSMAVNHLGKFFTQKELEQMREFLQRLYRYRLYADYIGTQSVSQSDCNDARKMSGRIVKLAQLTINAGR